MKALKQLAGETALYGISTVVPRLLNFLLVPLHTYALANQADYGIIGKLLAYVAFLNVLYTYGMETSFFRFATKSPDRKKITQTIVTALLSTTLLFTVLLFIFSGSVASFINEPGKSIYVKLFAIVVALDALSVIPFASLRLDSKAKKYVAIKILNVLVAIGLNLFFFLPAVLGKPDMFAPIFSFKPEHAAYYVFIAFIAGSLVQLLFFLSFYIKTKLSFKWTTFKPIWNYGWPLLILGFAGIANEVFDRAIMDQWLPGSEAENKTQLGIYNACYKLGMILNIAVAAFRMGAEPFFFRNADKTDAKPLYAATLKYFVIFSLLIFLGVLFYLNIFKRFIDEPYWEGLYIVPYILMAYVFLGIFYNLNIWYKLTDQTKIGMYITIVGAAFTVALNYFLLPKVGILGAAIATLAAYIIMCIISYLWGRKYYPIPYEKGNIIFYILMATGIYLLFRFLGDSLQLNNWTQMAFNTLGLLFFVGVVFFKERKELKLLFDRTDT